MSNKSDNDNRSNQLNPNNDAYYSSRGTSRYDDDSDDDYKPALDWTEVFRNEVRKLQEIEMRAPINEEFTFDFMSMSGKKAHIKATAQLPNKQFYNSLFSDCTDLIEKVLYPRLRKEFEQVVNSPVAFSRVRNGNGNELIWIQEEYRPQNISDLHHSPERQYEIAQLNKMWEQSTKFKVDDFKKLLQDGTTIPREDVGFIITTENYRQIRGY